MLSLYQPCIIDSHCWLYAVLAGKQLLVAATATGKLLITHHNSLSCPVLAVCSSPIVAYYTATHSPCLHVAATGRRINTHPNRRAPRCLPCGYHDEAGEQQELPFGSFKAPEGCPCTYETVCKAPGNEGYFGPNCEWLQVHPGLWYFIHGGESSVQLPLFLHVHMACACQVVCKNVFGHSCGWLQVYALTVHLWSQGTLSAVHHTLQVAFTAAC